MLENEIYKSICASNGVSPNPVKVEYAPGVDHISHQHDIWTMSGWKKDEVQLRGTHIIDDVEKLQLELANDIINGKNTTARPTYLEVQDNVITLIGLTESAKRDSGETSTTLNWNSVGTSSTAADESQTDLQAEDTGGSYARQVYSSAGQRKVVNQTGKYGMLWDDTKVSAAGVILTESGLHYHLSNSSALHARVVFTAFTLESGNLFVTQINELHQNG